MVLHRGQAERKNEKGSAFIERTLKVWQTRCQRELTSEDTRQITENVVGFFRILSEWETKEKLLEGRNLKKTLDKEKYL